MSDPIVISTDIHATMSLVALPDWGGAPPTITITGPAPAVIAAVGQLARLAGAGEVVTAEIRRCPVHEGEWVIVDARQAAGYSAYLAEATPVEFVEGGPMVPFDLGPTAGWKQRAVDRAKRDGVLR